MSHQHNVLRLVIPVKGVISRSRFVATLAVEGVASIPILKMSTVARSRPPVQRKRPSKTKYVNNILFTILELELVLSSSQAWWVVRQQRDTIEMAQKEVSNFCYCGKRSRPAGSTLLFTGNKQDYSVMDNPSTITSEQGNYILEMHEFGSGGA